MHLVYVLSGTKVENISSAQSHTNLHYQNPWIRSNFAPKYSKDRIQWIKHFPIK